MNKDDLRNKVFEAQERLAEAERQQREAHGAYRAALKEYADAVAFEVYGFRVGDVIEFTKKKGFGKAETVRMKITYFGVSARVRDHHDYQPSIHGVRVKKDGTEGTKSEYCYPSLREYSDIKLIERTDP